MYPLVRDVDNGGGNAWGDGDGRAEGISEIPVSSQFCCEPRSTPSKLKTNQNIPPNCAASSIMDQV